MAGSVNKVILIGNLGRDPEVRHGQDGGKIVSLNVATSESWKDASGEKREKTEWHRVVIFNDRIGDVAEKFLKKGHKVYLEGAMQTRKWTDPQGVERYMTEVVIGKFRGELTMLENKGDGSSPPPASGPGDYGRAGGRAPTGGGGGGFTDPNLDDEIPFITCAPGLLWRKPVWL